MLGETDKETEKGKEREREREREEREERERDRQRQTAIRETKIGDRDRVTDSYRERLRNTD